MIQCYETLPLTIEAVQLKDTLESIDECLVFMNISLEDWYARNEIAATALRSNGLIIHTLEGDMKANFGDYIIRGVLGEYYPCKEKAFVKKYKLLTK